jgi:hypothetical protein
VFCHSSQITVTGCLLLLGLLVAIGLAFLIVAIIVPVIVVAFGTVFALILVLGLVLLVCLGLRLADGVPKLLLLVLLGLGEVLLLEEDLTDVVALERLLGYLLVMWDKIFIQFVTEVLYILENDGIGLVIDTGEETFKALSALELDVDLIGKEILDWRNAHHIFN